MQTIFIATDRDGCCFAYYAGKPLWDGSDFGVGYGNQFNRYHGPNMPPPGECWEYRLTRKGDIDTDGEPIGWKIVGIGKDGSVLCQKGNGQRRRYLFGDWVKEQPSGEAWERLINAVADYARNVGMLGPRGETIKKAWKAYEAAQSADEPNEKQKQRFIEACQDDLAKLETAVEVLTKERDEALSDLANERAACVQVTTEQTNFIAELQEQIRKLKVESATQTDAISEREDRIDQLSGEVQRLTAKLERPEMPECVRELVDAVCLDFPFFFAKNIAAVEAHYAPPFRIQGPGVYSAKLGKDKELVIRLFHHRQDGWLGYFDGTGAGASVTVTPSKLTTDGWLGYFDGTGAVWLFDDSGRAGGVQLTKFLRPLE